MYFPIKRKLSDLRNWGSSNRNWGFYFCLTIKAYSGINQNILVLITSVTYGWQTPVVRVRRALVGLWLWRTWGAGLMAGWGRAARGTRGSPALAPRRCRRRTAAHRHTRCTPRCTRRRAGTRTDSGCTALLQTPSLLWTYCNFLLLLPIVCLFLLITILLGSFSD